MSKFTILISDKFDEQGVRRLQSQSDIFNVIYDKGCTRDEFLKLLPQAHGLIVRSQTKVDKEALTKAEKLKIVLRAGVGVDNINIAEASKRGIIVSNAPGGNTVSTAEQALSLLFASARRTPQANQSMKAGKWEKSKFKGSELTGKTIGVVGLGRIGAEVAYRAKGLRMKVIGYDPYIAKEKLEHLEIELVDREEILSRSDFISVHTPLTDSTKNFINTNNIDQLKDGVILINAARGGIYNEDAIVEGLKSGKLGAAALDVFCQEPLPESSPLRQFDNCIMTPHLGASTGDAEFAVAMEAVDTISDYFKSDIAQNALNFPSMDANSMNFLKPYYEGAICVGKILGQLGKDINHVDISYYGDIAHYQIASVSAAIQYGLLVPALGSQEQVNIVNAPLISKERGIQINENQDEDGRGFSSFVKVQVRDSQQNVLEAQYTSLRKQPLIFSLFNLPMEFKPEGILLSIKNRDVPGVVGTVGNFLGKHGVNIAHLELSRNKKGGNAYCILSIDELLSQDKLEELEKLENLIDVNQIDLR